MANMITRTIANATERALSTLYLWGHIQGAPSVDRRIAMSDMVFKDASGNVNIGGTSFVSTERLSLQGAVSGNFFSLIRNSDSSVNGYAGMVINPSGNSWAVRAGSTSANSNALEFIVDFLGTPVRRWEWQTTGHLLPGGDNTQDLGAAARRMRVIYAGTGTINTSDEREKTEIGDIPDSWLDAWADVQWQRFKFVDGNRWHVGLIAQAVHSAFADHGLNAFEIGLCCYDEWQEERAPILETVTKTRMITVIEQEPAGEDENGEPLFRMREVEVEEEYQDTADTGETRVTLEAGDRWGLRYDECQAIEAAWQRREISRLADRLAALESAAQ